jgi:hypothetical protein
MSHRINLYAGPGSGKSTTAAWLFSELKVLGYSIELTSEYVKAWSYSRRPINQFDQIYLLGKQMQYEYRYISNGVKNIVTDSPVLLSCIYAELYYPDLGIHKPMTEIAQAYENSHPGLNIFLDRGEKFYDSNGRYQTYEEAKMVDKLILDKLAETKTDFIKIPYNDREAILRHVIKTIEK